MSEQEISGPASVPRVIRRLEAEPAWWLVSAAAVLVSAVLARVVLYLRFPILLTNDSPDYLLAGERIAAELDFMNAGLRDWRLPGYPLFLALAQWLAEWRSTSVVAVQSLGGVLCVGFGIAAGRFLGLRLGSVVLGAFLALHPVYLLSEHLVMTEALFILLLWSVATVGIAALRDRPEFLPGLLLGALLSWCVLTRANGLFFCVPVVAGLIGLSRIERGAWRARLASLAPFAFGILLAVTVLVGLWAYRNDLFLGRPRPFTNNFQRALLIYQAQHDFIDPELPEIRRFGFDPATPSESAYRLVEELAASGSIAAEAVARRIVREQVRERKRDYLQQVGYSLLHYSGFRVPTRTPGRSDMTYWFHRYAGHFPLVHTHNLGLARRSGLEYVAVGRGGRVLRWWSAAGTWHLNAGRGLLSSVFALAVAVLGLTGGLRPTDRAGTALLALTLGLLSAAAAHAVMLADYDRFAMPFDGFQVLVILGVTQRARRWDRAFSPPR